MMTDFARILAAGPVTASAPCRLDMGGTLDIGTLFLPLHAFDPCTVNVAVDLRTEVRLTAHKRPTVRVSSSGFESAEYPVHEAPFDHPLGLMFAIAAYFDAAGADLNIVSASPPRSALGGSSAAAVAAVGAFSRAFERTGAAGLPKERVVMLAHALEQGVARVPCGLQDQLAAAYGGVNCWQWTGDEDLYHRSVLIANPADEADGHFLAAYCGIQHESKDINTKWMQSFLAGIDRAVWREMADLTRRFADALKILDWRTAAAVMNRETELRRQMTPEVLDPMGEAIVEAAAAEGCGAKFTGAGGGGCLWAIGETNDIERLKPIWSDMLDTRPGARLLDARTDTTGLRVEG